MRYELVSPLQEGLQAVLGGLTSQQLASGCGLFHMRGKNTMSYVFYDATIISCQGDANYGPFFTVSFSQPKHLAKESKEKRKEYWMRKKLLMQDSLVLLIKDPGKADMALVPLIVAKREETILAQAVPSVGLSCAFNQGPCTKDLTALLSWMRSGGTTTKGPPSPLLLVQTRSNYISCAPILRALHHIDRDGPFPLMEKLILLSQSTTPNFHQMANSDPPAYIKHTR